MKSSNGYKRTPNTACVICEKPLYRRPFELKKARFACCRGCRKEAYKKYPSDKALTNLKLGRKKGTNNLDGIPKSQESKDKRSASMKIWAENNPEKVAARGKKTRGGNHYNWKGGSSRLNSSIRRMTENRRWMDAVKARDGSCTQCGGVEDLESHHIVELSDLISKHGIKNRKDARATPELWDIKNGVTLCRKCHFEKHGRNYIKSGKGRRSK